MKPLVEQDYYETLDVARSAGFEDIERAYRLACDTYCEDSLAGYPVFEVGDVELLRERIEVAYRILVDPETRRAYDLELSAQASEALVRAPTAPDDRAEAADEVRPTAPVLAPLDALDELDADEGEWTGARLRRARLRQGIELDEITKITKVNPTYLAFIEDERFDGLPAAVYVRGFVVGYAGCLGLDAESAKRVAASYLQRYEERKGAAKRRLFSRK
jgi:flagellar biosynthesis protein FlhG